jgi:TM2 domain-containing membrane protein YozV
MYRVIGVNGQQYGPVTPEEVRRWITENRVNAQTLAQLDATQEWKPLISFPEFTADFKAQPASACPPAPPVTDPRAGNKIAAGICGILLGSLGIHKFILGYTGAGLIMLLVTLLTCFVASPVMHLIGLIEGIIYLTKSDVDFVKTYVEGRREWF